MVLLWKRCTVIGCTSSYSHEKLWAVGVLPTVGHGQQEGSVVFESEVLVCREQRKRDRRLRVRSLTRDGSNIQGRKQDNREKYCLSNQCFHKDATFFDSCLCLFLSNTQDRTLYCHMYWTSAQWLSLNRIMIKCLSRNHSENALWWWDCRGSNRFLDVTNVQSNLKNKNNVKRNKKSENPELNTERQPLDADDDKSSTRRSFSQHTNRI